ncbi:metallophosphoesterase [Kineobactrum sediminis]|nr:metallophosphoesterase [Kineobactrum sediminis]
MYSIRYNTIFAGLVLLLTVFISSHTLAEYSFVIFGDSGYIPAYEDVDTDETPLVTVEDYLAEERSAWEKRHNTTEFKPAPMVFESTVGGFLPASGLYPVAWAMEDTCKQKGCQFAAMLGDNVYPDGGTLGADARFDSRRYRDMLHKPFHTLGSGIENFTIYSVMGNHDWRISREATMSQMLYLQEHPSFYMPDYFYRVSPPATAGDVEIFVIDTEMLLASTTVYKDKLAADGSGREVSDSEIDEFPAHAAPQTAAEQNMVDWLEHALATSAAKWKIVLGHHALWSGGGSKFEKARALRKLFLPALCRHADAYFSGDDHMLEIYTDGCAGIEGAAAAPLPTMVTGAGAKWRPNHPAFIAQQEKKYPGLTTVWSRGPTWGFMYVTLDGEQMHIEAIVPDTDFSGSSTVEKTVTFTRRSGGARQAD